MLNEERSSSAYPFTPSQWQELQRQALIYKYMVAGIPIPSDLILPIRKSLFFDSNKTSPSLAFPTQTQLGWRSVQMGFGRETKDLEPGRCRRTDGKKWRCSKQTYHDSKYCERHMHRGKTRSRKHREISPATSINYYSSHPANLSISTPDKYQFLNPPSNTIRRPGCHFSTTSRISNLQRNTVSFSNRGYRNGQRMKTLNGYSILSDAFGAERENSLQLKPPGMSSLMEANQRSNSLSKEEEKERQKHASGAEWVNSLQLKPQGRTSLIEAYQGSYSLSTEEEEEKQWTLHHFFDEWPQKNKESWMKLEENTSYTKSLRPSTKSPSQKWF